MAKWMGGCNEKAELISGLHRRVYGASGHVYYQLVSVL